MNTDPAAQAWALLLAARSMADRQWFGPQSTVPLAEPVSFVYDAQNAVAEQLTGSHSAAQLSYGPDDQWRYGASLPGIARDFFDLYLPALGNRLQPSVVTGHLGQSVDSRVATVSGDAFFVTGEENRQHLHRMRALSHAVIVGASTVVIDNPQLTTRDVAGESPVRVIIDPHARVSIDTGLLNDQCSQTVLLHNESVMLRGLPVHDGFKRLGVPAAAEQWTAQEIKSVLAAEGLHRLFVEGGGVTVSRFLTANGLDQLQIAAAPLLVGEGRPAIQLPGALSMRGALRPPHRLYRMGEDILWDFDLRGVVFDANGMAQQEETDAEPSVQGDIVGPSVQRLF